MPTPLAVLIDGENVDARLFGPLRERVAALGTPVSWQIFGDFISWPHPHWQEVCRANGIDIRHQFQGGKNSADIAMTIAAMDLMHAGKVGGICLVSSDSDFSALARRLRADALEVYGLGEDKAPASLRDACSQFFVLDLPPACVEAAPMPDQFDARRLHELLHAVCRERGSDGRVLVGTAANYVRDAAGDLFARISGNGKFLRHIRSLDFVEIHLVDNQILVSVRHHRPRIVLQADHH